MLMPRADDSVWVVGDNRAHQLLLAEPVVPAFTLVALPTALERPLRQVATGGVWASSATVIVTGMCAVVRADAA